MTKHFSLMALLASALVMVACGGKEPAPEGPTTDKDPSLSIDSQMTIDGKSGTYTIPFQLENPVSGTSVKTSTECDWVFALHAETDKLMFKVSNNLGATRTADINVTYGADIKKTVSLTQERFVFGSFDMEVKDVRARAAKLIITPKGYKGNYFFEILSKSRVDELNALDLYSIGDKEYGNALAKDDLEYLKERAAASKTSLADFLSGYAAMYKVTENGEPLEMDYTDLRAGKTYYAVAYGLDLEGKRQTEICLFEFTTASTTDTDLTFDDMISNVTQNSARITITPSNDVDTYYWTYASQTDMATLSLEEIMDHMTKNIVEAASIYGVPLSSYLSKGKETSDIEGLSMGTSYTIVAWGLDTEGNPTTKPQQLSTFRTKTNEVTDDCKFTVEFLEIEDMDVKLQVNPTNASTRYYIAVIDEKRCTNYNDYQMVQRVLNMETSNLERGVYGTGVTWADHPDLFTGTQTKWARRDLGWEELEPNHSYRVYVFGVDNDGHCTTEIFRKDVQTAEPQPSDMTFEVTLNPEATWHYAVFDIKPSNEDDYYMPYLVRTADLDAYRYNDGSLMERELMDKIRDVYEDEISRYVYRKTRSIETTWTSNEQYSLILFGYSGTNTTPMYEFKFKSPEIPFNKASCDINYTYELFNGDDLADMAPEIWESHRGDCVMRVSITVTGDPANYYFGLWPPKENFKTTGGIDHLITLCQMDVPGDNIINKKYGVLIPWWGGASKGVFETDEGEVLDAMPWSITAYAEDENHNYGPLHYELFIPEKKPEDQVTGKYHKGYTKAYDFWSSPSATNVKTLVIASPKVEFNK